MLAAPMKPTELQIQNQIRENERNHFSQSIPSPSSSEQMIAVSPAPLSPHKRPKLSLKTSSVPMTFGKSSTALSATLGTFKTSSPTVRNTFNNAYEIPHRPSPTILSPNVSASKWPKPIAANIAKREEQPYEVPMNIKGILRNTPYISSLRRSSSSATSSASPRHGRRVFFPAVKKVGFRNQLEDEIKTFTFTARHSDLSSDEESDDEAQIKVEGFSDIPVVTPPIHGVELFPFTSKPATPAYASIAEHDDDKDEVTPSNASYDPEHPPLSAYPDPTPSTKRKRRSREWRWTLGSVDEDGGASIANIDSEINTPSTVHPIVTVDSETNTPTPTSQTTSPRPSSSSSLSSSFTSTPSSSSSSPAFTSANPAPKPVRTLSIDTTAKAKVEGETTSGHGTPFPFHVDEDAEEKSPKGRLDT